VLEYRDDVQYSFATRWTGNGAYANNRVKLRIEDLMIAP
jgi:hypothetical protein